MGFSELINLLKQQNESGKGFLIHLNTDDLEEKSCRNTGIEFADLYFTNCTMIRNGTILVFENINRKPVQHKEDGTPLYTIDSNSSMYIDVAQIEVIEKVQDDFDWFLMPTKQVVHLYMLPENNSLSGNRNVVTIGFMDWREYWQNRIIRSWQIFRRKKEHNVKL